jgi:hypothetical protein
MWPANPSDPKILSYIGSAATTFFAPHRHRTLRAVSKGVHATMIEQPISSWAELSESLFADTWNPTIRRFRSTFAYRGVADASWQMKMA